VFADNSPFSFKSRVQNLVLLSYSPMTATHLDKVMLRLTCFEPAGGVLELSPDDLTRHVIGLGATGSGKTTALVNPVLQQIICWKATEHASRVGLLVLDPKADDSAAKIADYARAAGRAGDLVVLSEGGDAWYDLLGGLDRLDQIEIYARRLLSGTRDMGKENAYWTETRKGLMETALVLLLANGAPVPFADALSFMQAWWFSTEAVAVESKLRFVRKVLSRADISPLTRRRLELALIELGNWNVLDDRTKGLHKSSLSNALRPLLTAAAQGLFEPKTVLFRPQAVLEGKILVVSLDAISHPDLARLVFRVVRRDFYAAVQSRPAMRPEHGRLCGLVADELPLSVMPEDVEALSVIRAKGGFVLAACQSISGLDEILGWRGREALLANFNSVFFFSSRESAVDEYALITLGTREQPDRNRNASELGDLQVIGRAENRIQQSVCPPGALARLQQHQAFVKLADGSCTERPVWLQPSFFNLDSPSKLPVRDDLAEVVANIRALEAEDAIQRPGGVTFLAYMHSRSHRLFLTPEIIAAAWQICVPSHSRNQILANVRCLTIRGLEALPSCWLRGLICWLDKCQNLAETIQEVSVESGVLWPTLAAAATLWGDGPTMIPEAINLAIYPSLWRPLQPKHLARLELERPDLRNELRLLPQALKAN
jgi:hypothetical protein